MNKALLILVGLIALAPALHAHPHDDVEQQALLSIGLDKTNVEIRIVPSFDEGADILAHLDRNGDGTVSEDEAAEFGTQVLSQSSLTVNGQAMDLTQPDVVMPDPEKISSGLGVISISAQATYPTLDTDHAHKVAFEVTYEDLAHGWFIQPFFFSDLNKHLKMRSLDRSKSGLSIEVTFDARNS